jgi:hypothetical protein
MLLRTFYYSINCLIHNILTLMSKEIECGIGMYIGKQLQKINQLEKEVTIVKEQLAEVLTKHNQILQRNEYLEKRWNDLKNAAKNQS